MKSKIIEVTATVSQTVQIKQYEPRVYTSTIKMEVASTDNADEVLLEARKKANEEVEGYFKSLKAKSEINSVEIKYTGILKPEILTHPNIPKPLHGIAPRTIMGDSWWNKTRKEVYATTDFHCVACGVAKEDAKGHKWLEAHEFWDIDYSKGIAEVKSIEPLCHYCHNFIHSGRLSTILGKEKSESEVKDILEHGFKILSANSLKCFPGTLELAENIGANTYGVKPYDIPNSDVKWSDWKLKFEGNEYKSQFENIEEWQKHYEDINKGVK